ncbi:MAG: phosphohydrolase [Lachnospiraceae bacterium]|nr:phosphohydrolase [Lachnospiraceae bacterium]
MSEHITTSHKVHFKPLEPELEGILIEDVAHALSLMTRANGHFPEFYSVAQHCVGCYEEALARQERADERFPKGYTDEVCLMCLLHDASEAYIADITRPVKKELSEYLGIEKRLQDAIYTRFLGRVPTDEERRLVSSVDDAMLSHEFYHYMGEWIVPGRPALCKEPEFCEKPFREVEEQFLTYFRKARRAIER